MYLIALVRNLSLEIGRDRYLFCHTTPCSPRLLLTILAEAPLRDFITSDSVIFRGFKTMCRWSGMTTNPRSQ